MRLGVPAKFSLGAILIASAGVVFLALAPETDIGSAISVHTALAVRRPHFADFVRFVAVVGGHAGLEC